MRASRPRRSRPPHGQHFLRDLSVVERILDCLSARPEETVVEIGPGRGALTMPLLRRGLTVFALEIDAGLADALRQEARGLPLTVVTGDALTVDIGKALLRAGAALPVPLVGNLPYESATPMVRSFVRRADLFSRLVVMVQKEVADRLVARPRTAAYGFLTLDVGAHASARRLFDVPSRAFAPPPAVASSVVALLPREPAAGTSAALAVASLGFSKRRKTLVGSLSSRWARPLVAAVLRRLGLPPASRPEELGFEEFRLLAMDLEPAVPAPPSAEPRALP